MGFTNNLIINLLTATCSIFFITLVYSTSLLIASQTRALKRWTWFSYTGNLQFVTLGATIIILVLLVLLAITLHFHMPTSNICINLFYNNLTLEINDLSVMFLLLVAFLFPVVVYLASFEFSAPAYKFFTLLILLYFLVFIFIMCNDIIIFYITYEFLIALVFFIMYLSANTRGGIEATMLFLGWAVLGSILVGLAVVYIVYVSGTSAFNQIKYCAFSTNEVYYLSLLIFMGFGTKLSIWPFWYWLPRAHVEVSTAVSIFLSCILIKVCLYGFMRMIYILNQDIIIMPLIFFVIACTFDVVYRLSQQVDLKAVVAYSSVLHVNLLILLVLLSPTQPNIGLIIYIWGHSYTTAGLFFAVHLIERCYNSRSTFEISGVCSTNPAIGLVCIFAVISCLEFPLNFYFWGEAWLWFTLFGHIPIIGAALTFLCAVTYVVIFFRIWWGILFGAPSQLALNPTLAITITDLYLFWYVIGIQYLIGLQPSIFSVFINNL